MSQRLRRSAGRVTRPVVKADTPNERTARRFGGDLDAILRALAASALSESAARELGAGNVDAFLGTLDWDTLAYSIGERADLLGGVEIAEALRAAGPLSPVNANLVFDIIEPRAVNYAAQRAASLIRDVSDQVRQTVRPLVVSSLNGDLTVRELQSRIARVIPLHTRYAQAVDNAYRNAFQSLVDDGVSAEKAHAQATAAAERLSARLTRARAEAIARTEVMTAANTGRFEGWSSTIATGLDSAESKKEWITGGDPCPDCDPLDGETVEWDKPFSNGAMMPPLHVSCRCVSTLLPADTPTRAGSGRRSSSGDDWPGEGPRGKGTSRPGETIDLPQDTAETLAASARAVSTGAKSAEAHAATRAELTGIAAPPPKATPATRVVAPADPLRLSAKEANAWATENMPDVKKILPKDVQDEINRYTGGGYKGTNQALRSGVFSGYNGPIQQKMVDALDEAMKASRTPVDLVVSRRVHMDAIEGMIPKGKDAAALVGKVISDKGFMSTAVGGSSITSGPIARMPVEFEIVVPAGTPAVWTRPVSQFKSERELLLDRGTKLAVQSATMNERTGKWLIQATVVPSKK